MFMYNYVQRVASLREELAERLIRTYCLDSDQTGNEVVVRLSNRTLTANFLNGTPMKVIIRHFIYVYTYCDVIPVGALSVRVCEG